MGFSGRAAVVVEGLDIYFNMKLVGEGLERIIFFFVKLAAEEIMCLDKIIQL